MRECHASGVRHIDQGKAGHMKQFAFALTIVLGIAPALCAAQANDARIKELAALHVGDYCHADVKCQYEIFPSRPEAKELVVQVTRTVDVAGWPLYPNGDMSLQMRFSKSGKFLSKKTISPDAQPELK